MMNRTRTVIAALVALTATTTVVAEDFNSAQFAATPLSLTRETTPLVMLAMSVDHQLFYKAYSDYTDLDSDGRIDTKYLDGFTYRGYFDPEICYTYNNEPDGYFQAYDLASTSQDTNTAVDIRYSCEGSQWSGNFLNWATMSRIDMLRSVLFGGKRSTDTKSQTILERAELPADVHSFAKVSEDYDATSNGVGVSWYHIVPDEIASDITESSITMCNTTDNDTGDPVLRIVKGTFDTWSSKEGRQCQYESSSDYAPSTGSRIFDLTVRVEVCSYSSETINGSRCRLYTDGTDNSYKPIGLLQTYGEDGRIQFGLISGSYHRNLDGGVIRKLISRIGGNEDSNDDEINQNTGIFNDNENGIIQTLNKIKIANYNFSSTKYDDCNSPGISLSQIKGNEYTRHCSNWGNPIAEIYYEALRYFSGELSPRAEFSASIDKGGSKSESNFISGIAGLVSANSWTDPLDATNYCAECAIILLSSGTPSFDVDGWDRLTENAVTGLGSASDLEAKTNSVGNQEYNGIDGQYISQEGGNCIETTVGSLSGVDGLCPDGPQVEGGYHVAGLAYHARTTDLRNDYDSLQSINTYAIELGESVPAIEFKVNGSDVRLVPTCQSKSGGDADDNQNYLGCSLYNFIVNDASYTSNGDLIEASYTVFWEDSLWGNDYDLDGAQRIEICTLQKSGCDLSGGDDMSITQQWVYTAAGFKLRASYAITGTTDDGLNTDWTIKDDDNINTGNSNGAATYNFDTDDIPIPRQIKTFNVNSSGQAVELLQKPLYLAAKFGGFKDKNGNNKPDLVSEWDEINNDTGAKGADGIPDQYFEVKNPTNLINQLNRVFASIIERVATGSNAAVVANRSSGNGAIYQALYYPRLTKGDTTISWAGQLHSLFVDSAGLVREDTNGNGILDDYPTTTTSAAVSVDVPGDFIVDVYFDENDRRTYFQRYVLFDATGVTQSDGSVLGLTNVAVPFGTAEEITELDTIWNAPEVLANIPDADIPTQRDYDDPADTGRYITTAKSSPCTAGGTVECDTIIDFNESNEALLSGYLGLTGSAESKALINFIRGQDQAGMRSRQFDFDGNGTVKTWRLGDIIHSTPAVVERPSAGYDTRFSDNTYEAFRSKYQDRRRMIYVGGNDGMIHGFNGGYWSSTCSGFYTQSIQPNPSTGITTCPTASLVDATDHPLGGEMFGFIPTAMLPHLKWLAEPSYPHVYYMDGEPMVFDARVFENSETHPNGWGTLLVIGMRQGGGTISVDHDLDSTTTAREFKSGFVILDVTDPEEPPELFAQISPSDMGHAFSQPAVVKRYKPGVGTDSSETSFNIPAENKWYLVFGNGPSSQKSNLVESTVAPTLYVYDLGVKVLEDRKIDASLLGMAMGFSSVDWDVDGIDDAVYFGTVNGTIANSDGDLYRLRTNTSMNTNPLEDLGLASLEKIVEVDLPIPVQPNLSRTNEGERWIYFGTGRFFAPDDRQTDVQQRMYGVLEPYDSSSKSWTWGAVVESNLVAASDIKVFNDNTIKTAADAVVQVGGEAVPDYDALKTAIASEGGWYRNLTLNNTEPSGRNIRNATVYLDQLIFTEYLPSDDMCLVDGRSNLYAISRSTGTALPYDPLGSTAGDPSTLVEEVAASVDAGVGEFSGGTVFETTTNITLIGDDVGELETLGDLDTGNFVFPDSNGGGNCVFVQSSTGEMVCIQVNPPQLSGLGRQSWRELEILF